MLLGSCAKRFHFFSYETISFRSRHYTHTLTRREKFVLSHQRGEEFFLYDDALSNENFLLFASSHIIFFHHALKINFQRCFRDTGQYRQLIFAARLNYMYLYEMYVNTNREIWNLMVLILNLFSVILEMQDCNFLLLFSINVWILYQVAR